MDRNDHLRSELYGAAQQAGNVTLNDQPGGRFLDTQGEQNSSGLAAAHRLARRLLSLVVTFACIATLAGDLDAAQPANLLAGFARSQLLIVTSRQQCLQFDVYVAATSQQRTNGLMHISEMDTYEGMIFLYPQSARITMWMKNTLIPLDMLFISASGIVKTVHTNAVPLSTAVIDSGIRVDLVLELNGGTVDAFGIQPNDRIIFPFSPL